MIARLFIITILLISLSAQAATAQAPRDSLIRVLDRTISERNVYQDKREQSISELRSQCQQATDAREKFAILGSLLNEFLNFNTDSALSVCHQREAMASALGDGQLMLKSQLTTANTLSGIGMYKEAIDIMDAIDPGQVPSDEKQFYYHIYRTTYGLLADYALRDEDRMRYLDLTDQYRDSLLSTYDPQSFHYGIIRADQLNAHNQPRQAIDLLLKCIDATQGNPHAVGVSAYTLSESYRMLGDTENQMHYLLLSAIGDMESATKEYVSLRKLALLLYQEGDIDHAYRYLHLCMDDALDCNARMRMLEVNQIINAVNQAYLEKIEHQQARLRLFLVLVCVLAALLVGALYWLSREKKKETEANARVKKANQELTEANQALAESSNLKQEYITQYMDRCTMYIEKLDHGRKALKKIANSGSMAELKKYNSQQGELDDDIRDFYDHFDETFLKLFPTFVEEFNALLLPEEQIVPKGPGMLTTELRIFALIRLGITDSAKIAQFLRYSVATIYTYRTRVRSKARGNRDELEAEIMKIGKN